MTTRKSRKSLNDVLANEFVYEGESEPESPPSPQADAPKGSEPEDLKPPALKSQASKSSESKTQRSTNRTATSPTSKPQASKPPEALPELKSAPTSYRARVNQTKQRRKSRYAEFAGQEANVMLKVELPGSMYKKLAIVADKIGNKKAEIVKMILADALDDLIAEISETGDLSDS